MPTTKRDYSQKMTDIDAKIKALRKQRRKLQKDHEVKDLKLKVKSQSEQIAQLTADNRELTAKLSSADMSSVAFDPTPKLEKQSKKIESLTSENKALKEKLSPFKEYRRQNGLLNNKLIRAMQMITELSKRCGQDPETYLAQLKKVK